MKVVLYRLLFLAAAVWQVARSLWCAHRDHWGEASARMGAAAGLVAMGGAA